MSMVYYENKFDRQNKEYPLGIDVIKEYINSEFSDMRGRSVRIVERSLDNFPKFRPYYIEEIMSPIINQINNPYYHVNDENGNSYIPNANIAIATRFTYWVQKGDLKGDEASAYAAKFIDEIFHFYSMHPNHLLARNFLSQNAEPFEKQYKTEKNLMIIGELVEKSKGQNALLSYLSDDIKKLADSYNVD